MSALATIKADLKKFEGYAETDIAKFDAEFVKLFKEAPSALQTVDNLVNEVAPILTAAVALAAPVAEPIVAAALATTQTLLAALSASAQAANTGTSLLSNLQNFSATVPPLLSGLDIKNVTLKATVTKIVALVVGEAKVLIPAVESWVAQIKSSTPAAA